MLPNQSAYRRSHSTKTALTAVFTDNTSELYIGNLVLLSMLNVSATFNCMDHNILLKRLIYHMAFGWSLTSGWCPTSAVELSIRSSNHHVIRSHGFRSHHYDDDSQLHILCSPHEAQKSETRERTVFCVVSINSWMQSNRLLLNPSTTEFLWCATKQRMHCELRAKSYWWNRYLAISQFAIWVSWWMVTSL